MSKKNNVMQTIIIVLSIVVGLALMGFFILIAVFVLRPSDTTPVTAPVVQDATQILPPVAEVPQNGVQQHEMPASGEVTTDIFLNDIISFVDEFEVTLFHIFSLYGIWNELVYVDDFIQWRDYFNSLEYEVSSDVSMLLSALFSPPENLPDSHWDVLGLLYDAVNLYHSAMLDFSYSLADGWGVANNYFAEFGNDLMSAAPVWDEAIAALQDLR